MSTPLLYSTTKNAVQKTLDAALLAGATSSVTLNSVVGIQNKAGVFVVDRVDSNGTATPSKREYITFTGVSGSTLTGLTRNADGGGTDQDHAVGAIVEFVSDVLQEQAIIDGLLEVIDTNGALDTTKVVDLTTSQTLTNKTLTSPVLTTPQINDTSADHQYVVAVSELAADRTVTLPLLTGNDEFVFKDFTQTLTNKTLTSPTVNTPTLVLADTSPTADGSIGFDRTGEDIQVGDGTNSQLVHVGAWTAFTPAWGGITEGSGTNVGAYCILGKTCHFRAEFTFAANSSATGSFSLSLPVTKATGYNGTYDSVVGSAILFDAGTGNFQGLITSLGSIVSLTVSGANVIRATVNATSPFTWTTGDVLTVTGTYEIA